MSNMPPPIPSRAAATAPRSPPRRARVPPPIPTTPKPQMATRSASVNTSARASTGAGSGLSTSVGASAPPVSAPRPHVHNHNHAHAAQHTQPVRAPAPAPARRLAPPAQPHPMYMYDERPRPSYPTSSSASSLSSFSISSGFASRARAALSSAGSYVAASAANAAAAASAAASNVREGESRSWDDYWRASRPKGAETLQVLPGWAVKRPRADGGEDAFDLHVSVAGFCNYVRDADSMSRTQRAFVAIAKKVAALPPPPPPYLLNAPADEFSQLRVDSRPPIPPRPSSSTLASLTSTNAAEAAARARRGTSAPAESVSSQQYVPRRSASGTTTPTGTRSGAATPTGNGAETPERRPTSDVFADPRALASAHTWMDARLRPFWSSVLAGRRVAVEMYPIPLPRVAGSRVTDSNTFTSAPSPPPALFETEPLVRTTFTTDAQGHFAHRVVVPWERLATHAGSLGLAFADDPANDRTDWGVVVRAQLLAEERPVAGEGVAAGVGAGAAGAAAVAGVGTAGTAGGSGLQYAPRRQASTHGTVDTSPTASLGKTSVESSAVVAISRPGGIRIISDMDDTVKHTDILSGPREVFRNVFCRDLNDSCVEGMDELYAQLDREGLSGLHFVSNAPFELYPALRDFLSRHAFPAYYSLKLKFYGGRSIVSSLFEPAGQRKRPNVLEVLEAFDDSRFILIGDSGEQDLEVYTGIAHERPHQVAAIFIRDVTTRRADELRRVAAAAAAAGEFDDAPTPSSMSTRSGRSSPTPTSGISRTSTSDDLAQSAADLQQLSAAQAKVLRRAADWDARVARAHAETPSGVRLVFFEHVDEIRDLACALVAQEVERDVHPLPKHQHRFSYGTGAKTAEPEDAPDLIQF